MRQSRCAVYLVIPITLISLYRNGKIDFCGDKIELDRGRAPLCEKPRVSRSRWERQDRVSLNYNGEELELYRRRWIITSSTLLDTISLESLPRIILLSNPQSLDSSIGRFNAIMQRGVSSDIYNVNRYIYKCYNINIKHINIIIYKLN